MLLIRPSLRLARSHLPALPTRRCLPTASVSQLFLETCSTSQRSFSIASILQQSDPVMSNPESVASSGSTEQDGLKEATPRFPITPVEGHTNPLGEGRKIRSAACLIIGDEILNGKTRDSNSHYFAKFCFAHGIDLKRIEVVADDEAEIAEAAARMVENYDFIITCGGIGPTHDDITYASLATAFNLTLKYDPETVQRMQKFSKNRKDIANQNEEQKEARNRMALFPHGENEEVEILYVDEEMWVPVVRIHGKLCVFPGIPRLYERMLNGLVDYLPLSAPDTSSFRHMIFTTMPESSIAPYLTTLQKRVKDEGIKIGSYPQIHIGVTVSLIGKNKGRVLELGQEIVEKLDGKVVVGDEDSSEGKL
ncbi:hypothetical protein FRB94_012027 [Tulasnella sp. JGI-2019a]|nr:hypothetical protein FRB93_010435 [Tulasnella sp. JGI-2019a]KAG8992085.1 hypothetical protein FRB94_012027 [Tulasnella sp. JGI-2019a]KAG9024180.1 hypothetical protein FRB95_011976 [Tulasnella sp. JGI-2019a]